MNAVAVVPIRETPPDNELRLRTLDEFVQRPCVSYHVRNLIPSQSIVVVFGPPKGGKTFSICDLTMHAAHGMDWHGFKVAKPVRVAYLAGEGTTGLKVRLRGWIEHHDSVAEPGEFRILPEAMSLPDNAAELVEVMTPFRPDIVVIDTLNTYFGGSDENSTQDMTRFCHAVRRLRDAIGCSVVVIHHTGHGDQTRERGSIVLRASADVLIQVAKDESGSGNVGFQVIAARDMESMNEPLALRLRRVDTCWLDDEDQKLVTCIVEAADGHVTLAGRSKPLGAAQSVVIEVARKLARQGTPDEHGEVLLQRIHVAAVAKEQGVSRQSISSAWAALHSRRLLRLIEPGSVAVKVKP